MASAMAQSSWRRSFQQSHSSPMWSSTRSADVIEELTGFRPSVPAAAARSRVREVRAELEAAQAGVAAHMQTAVSIDDQAYGLLYKC